MSCFGEYEVISQSISEPLGDFELTIDAPAGKVALGAGAHVTSYSEGNFRYSWYPSADGTSVTFRFGIIHAPSGSTPWTGTAYVICASMGG